jgi:hypothetical protein
MVDGDGSEIEEEEYVQRMMLVILDNIKTIKALAKALSETKVDTITLALGTQVSVYCHALGGNLKAWFSYLAYKEAGLPMRLWIDERGLPAYERISFYEEMEETDEEVRHIV